MLKNFKSIILKISLVTVTLLLFACQKSNPATATYQLLFTDDIVNFGKQTALVSFDQNGKVIDTVKIDSALYYNLLPTDNGFNIDNGLQEITISSNSQEKTNHSELRGYFEQGHYVTYEETLIKFYNYGIEEETDKYFTKIEKQGQLLTVEGVLLAFQQDDALVYMIFQEYPEMGYPYYLATLDLQSFSFEKGEHLALNPNNDFSFFDNQGQGTHLLGLETNPETSQQRLMRISTTAPKNIQYYSLEVDFYQQYNFQSFFNYRDKSYIFDTNTNQLYQINFDEKNGKAVFRTETLQLGETDDSFIVQQIKGDKLYLLKLTSPYQISEIDLLQMRLIKQTSLDKVPEMNTLVPYSFYVDSQ